MEIRDRVLLKNHENNIYVGIGVARTIITLLKLSKYKCLYCGNNFIYCQPSECYWLYISQKVL